MSDERLLPCPFCGGEAKLIQMHQSPPMSVMPERDYFYVICSKCQSRSQEYIEYDLGYKNDYQKRIEENSIKAINAWNRRANESVGEKANAAESFV